MEASCLQPIDTVKTRMQLDKIGKYKSEMRSAIQCTEELS